MICPLLLVLFSCGTVDNAAALSTFPQARHGAELGGALDRAIVLEPAFLVAAADASWSVEDGVRAVGIDVYLDPRLFRDLQFSASGRTRNCRCRSAAPPECTGSRRDRRREWA